MNKETAEALEKSIQHWTDNVNAKDAFAISTVADDCALCSAFAKEKDNYDDWCLECPIYKRTGEKSCGDTPYNSAVSAHDYLLHAVYDNLPAIYVEQAMEKFKLAATEELEFLKSLREEMTDE